MPEQRTSFGQSNIHGNDQLILAGDIGATKTNLALFEVSNSRLSILKENTYKTSEFSELSAIIRAFLSEYELPDQMCFGVAGPVQNGKVKITNLFHQIDSREVSAQFNHLNVSLINDLEATAYGLAALESKDILLLHEGNKNAEGNAAIIAPGTGLGEAGLYWDEQTFHPFATEGGHCDFSPRTELDMELYTYLHKKFGHVSWERLISGPGIYNIYQFLRDVKGREEPQWLAERMAVENPPAIISQQAIENQPAICVATMKLFFRYLAHEASNLILKLKATGGLFIGGGILPKIYTLLNRDIFMEDFADSGRMSFLLKETPISIIMNDKTPLLGAAVYSLKG